MPCIAEPTSTRRGPMGGAEQKEAQRARLPVAGHVQRRAGRVQRAPPTDARDGAQPAADGSDAFRLGRRAVRRRRADSLAAPRAHQSRRTARAAGQMGRLLRPPPGKSVQFPGARGCAPQTAKAARK